MSQTILTRLSHRVSGWRIARRSFQMLGFVTLGLAGLSAVVSTAGCTDTGGQARPITSLEAPAFARKWAIDLQLPSSEQVSSIHVRDEHVIVYTTKGHAFVVRRSDGTLLFGTEVPGASFKLWPPVILKEFVVFPTSTSLEVYRFNGAHDRTIDVRAAIRADCVGEKSGVYVPIDSPRGGARIMRFDLNNKTLTIPVWEMQVWKGGVASSPALFGDTVYFAADVGIVYALNEQGKSIWPLQGSTFDGQAGVVAGLKADEVGLYIPCTDGKLYCIHRIQGSRKWQYFATGALEKTPVITTDSVYIEDPNEGWIAIDKIDNPDIKGPQFNRARRWANKDITQILSQDEKYVYCRSSDNHIVALDKKTGQQGFQSDRSDFHVFGTNGKDGITYTASRLGRLVAVQAIFKQGQKGEMVRLESPAVSKSMLASDGN